MNLSPYMKYGLIFSAIPMLATYALGHLFKMAFLPDIESAAEMPLDDPDRMIIPLVEYIFPFAILSGFIAFACWTAFMRKKPSAKKAVIAGLVTVFISYPLLGFAIGFIYPDIGGRLPSAVRAAFSLALFGNIMTFPLTYPLGAICGGLIGNRFLKSLPPREMHEFD